MSIITSLMAARVYSDCRIHALSEQQASLVASIIIAQRHNNGIKGVPNSLSNLNKDELFLVQLQVCKFFKSNCHVETYDNIKDPSHIEIAAELLVESISISILYT